MTAGESGLVVAWLPALLVVVGLLAVVVIELGGHLVAVARAAALADAAALAAVAASEHPPTSPRDEAARVVDAGPGRLESCRCEPGAGHARVVVSVEVPGLVRPRLGAGRQSARAEAVLADVPR